MSIPWPGRKYQETTALVLMAIKMPAGFQEPEPPLIPARRVGHGEAVEQDVRERDLE
jgi:hypothetical protein